MTDKGSVFSKGGGGTNFEQYVQTAFVTTLIIRGNVPCVPPGEIIEVAFQTTNRGYQTDDLLVIAKSFLGQHRMLVQVKYNIIFSSKNDTFKDVIKAFWRDFNNSSLFDKINDRLIIIKSGLNKNERNHIKTLLNWAKTHATEGDFLSEVNRIKAKRMSLDIFKSALKEANDDKPLTDKELLDFLRCLDVLEYDFLNQGSVDETYFLNLIKLSKSDSTATNEKEIWSSILSLVSKLNKDGGSVTLDSIQKDEIYSYFDIQKLTPYFKSVEKIESDSEVILKPLKSTINGFHIERTETNQSILNSINEFPFTIVTGKPGVGKSAAVKDVLHNEFSSASVFVFRADQFNESNLANVFSKQGINETIQDLISCISLIPDKIFVIDSLEKLLEGDPENAFKQLLSLLRDAFPDIKIVCTSRKYAIDLIFQKFGIAQNNLNIIEVNPLDERELNSVALQFPQLNQVLKNNNVKKLLQIPKYLDFAISSLDKEEEDYSNVSLTEFKNKLWNNIIEDITTKKSGLSRKRSKAFSNIAIKRAKKMSLFVEPDDDIDSEAIEALEKDEVIFRDKEGNQFSPSHDILEDWALVKHVAAKYDEYSDPKELFNSLSNEPAIRRAFRLWIEDYLIDDSEKINILIKASLKDDTIERYWSDEVLVAVFKSDDCCSFFKAFEKELLDNNGAFLNRCLHLIRTSCKESSLTSNNNFSILLPIGSGWKEAIYFVREHLEELDNLRLSILNFLFDWEYRLRFQKRIHPDEILAVKEIALRYINQIEKGDEFWQKDVIKGKSNDLISLLFNLVNVAKDEIKELIARAIIANDERSNWRIHTFYESIIKYCLSGLHSQNLAKELPEIITGTAWKIWKLEPKKEEETSFFDPHNDLDKEKCWGIENGDLRTFPSGIYKTPIYNLLFFHPLIGAKFIVDFVNYSVESFVNSEFKYKKDIVQLEIELNDGNISKQWGSWELWAAYRGLSVTNYLLESLLMSLEKYLLDLANSKTEISKKNLQLMYNYLLKNSNSVAITSVLSSVAIAYPEEVGKEMLPLLSVKEFYEWDLRRSVEETGCLAPYDDEIPFAQEERLKSNQLPHRRKYGGELRDFILYYQFNIGKLNEQIHKVFDKLQTKVGSDDFVWKKTLCEIDVRNYNVGEYDEKLGGFQIQPKYESDVSEFINSNQEEFEAQNTSLNYSGLLSKAYEKKGEISFQSWKECFKLYSKTENLNIFHDRPVTLAVLGLRDFKGELSEGEITWCIKTMADSILAILQDTFSRNSRLISYNLLEKKIALRSFHFLFDNIETTEDRNELIALMIYMLFAPFTEHEMNEITHYVRTVFFKSHPEIGKKVWVGLIKYAKFIKTNPYFHYAPDSERLKTAKENEGKFIQSLSINDDLTLNIEKIDLEKYEGYILARAFIATPYYCDEIIFTNFIKRFIILLLEDFKFEKIYSYDGNRKGRQIRSETIIYVELYLAELLLYVDIKISKSIIELLLNSIYDSAYSRTERDVFGFSSNILEYAIYKLDEIITNSNNEAQNKQLIDNFWLIWTYLYERIKTSGKPVRTSTLFLDIKWNTDLSHWKAFENKKRFYHEMVTELGASNTKSIINVFSTVGEKSFLPDGLSWLTELIKNNPNDKKYLVSASGERLIKRLFYNHISTIKNNRQLINDFVWILDNMIDLGSSKAYMFRENVIAYKKH